MLITESCPGGVGYVMPTSDHKVEEEERASACLRVCNDITVCCGIGNWVTLTAQLKVDGGCTEAASKGIGHSHLGF